MVQWNSKVKAWLESDGGAAERLAHGDLGNVGQAESEQRDERRDRDSCRLQ
jgi:hypothetical protein